MWRIINVILLWIFTNLAIVVQCYPTGAPDSVCSNGLIPGHGRKEHGVSPYQVSASSGRYSSNRPIRVRIESLTGDAFQGFVIQAQDSYGDPVVSGEWYSDQGKSIRKCGAITHRSPDPKQEVSLIWTPTRGSGSVTFVATIAKTKKLYYHNIKADVVGGSDSSASRKPTKSSASEQPSSHIFSPSDDQEFSSMFKSPQESLRSHSTSWWSMGPHQPHDETPSATTTKTRRPSSNIFFDSSFSSPESFHSLPSSSHRSFVQSGRPFTQEKFRVDELEVADASPSFAFVRAPQQPVTFDYSHQYEFRPMYVH